MADNEQKAMQLLVEAEKKLTSSKGFFGSLFGGSSKIEEAVECYQRAANMFKMAKNWSSAGKAISCLLKAIEIYTDMGRFTMAAKHHQSIAEMYESEAVDLERAVHHFEQAADYFRGEESNSSANKCLLKVAQYAAQLENYEKAIQIYEQVASASLESSLLKYSVKEYFFRAALCHLCVDVLNAQHAIERYQEQYPAFEDSREYKLIKTLIEHLEEQHLEGFTEAVKEYDSISRLDQWYTTVLLRIKKQVNDNPDLR
ncbi:Soluble NSF attachment protein [Eufriesea mexicana]|nr:Soluble NSF attachment protein [Eufriesea mexicana]